MIEVSTADKRIHIFSIVSGFEEERGDYDIYWSNVPNKEVNQQRFVGHFKADCPMMEIELDGGVRRLYFQLVDKMTGIVQVLGHRRLPIPNMINFRDLGGYPAAEGKHIRWGLLYRSDYFWNLQNEGEAYVKSLGIKTIIDYRNNKEIESRPNREIGARNQIQCDPGATTAALSGEMQSRSTDGDTEIYLVEKGRKAIQQTNHAGELQMLAQQRCFVTDPASRKAYQRALRILMEPRNLPADQHCRGGKDRTGFGVALLLAALGVPEPVILYDYMLTKGYRKDRNAYLLSKYKAKYQDPKLVEYLYSFFDIKTTFLEESFAEIRKKYNSILDYIRKELDISEGEISRLREYCLE